MAATTRRDGEVWIDRSEPRKDQLRHQINTLGGQVRTLTRNLRRTRQTAAGARNRLLKAVSRLRAVGQDALAVEIENVALSLDEVIEEAGE